MKTVVDYVPLQLQMQLAGERVHVVRVDAELHVFLDHASGLEKLPATFEGLRVVPRILTTGRLAQPSKKKRAKR